MTHHHKHHYYFPGVLDHLHERGVKHPFPGVNDSVQAAPQIERRGTRVIVHPAKRTQRLF